MNSPGPGAISPGTKSTAVASDGTVETNTPKGLLECIFRPYKREMTTPGVWDEYAKKYPIHPESQALTDLMAAVGAKPFHACTIEEARGLTVKLIEACAGNALFDGEEKEIVVPSPSNKNGIPITVYKPKNLTARPVICVYILGGGFIAFNRKSYEIPLKIIASQSGAIIVSVEIRLWPDQCSGPAPFDDAREATKWVMVNRTAIGGKPDSQVGIGGDTSGGQMAISIANDVKGVAFKVLIYPIADSSFQQASMKEFENSPVLSGKDVLWFKVNIDKQLPDHLTNPRFNAMTRTNLAGSPPTLILLAQLDPLRDNGLEFGKKLAAEKVKVKTVIIEGVPNIFFNLSGHFKIKAQEAYAHVVNFLKEFQ